MKKIVMPLLSVALLIAAIVMVVISIADNKHAKVIVLGNTDASVISMTPKEYQCSTCKMEIEQLPYAVEIVNNKGKTWFFDDMGCAVSWLEHQPFKDNVVIWTQTEDTHVWVDATKACYRRDARTPMNFGFAAQEQCSQGTIDYNSMRTKILHGETLQDPNIRQQLLGAS